MARECPTVKTSFPKNNASLSSIIKSRPSKESIVIELLSMAWSSTYPNFDKAIAAAPFRFQFAKLRSFRSSDSAIFLIILPRARWCFGRPTPGRRWAPPAPYRRRGTHTPLCGPIPPTAFLFSVAILAAVASSEKPWMLLGEGEGKPPPSRGALNDLYLYARQVRGRFCGACLCPWSSKR